MQFIFGRYQMDPALRELRCGGEAVHVEPQVFDLILHLVRNRERVVSQNELLDVLWHGRCVSESTFRSRINAARSALGDSGKRQCFIRTLPKRGFRFVGEVTTRSGIGETSSLNGIASISVVSGTTPAPTPPGTNGRPAVAVLPFSNLSDDLEGDHYADGITQDITTALAKHRSLLVIARSSAFAFKHHDGDMRDIGRELGADYLVEGSFHKVGQHVRVTAHLVEREAGCLIWADRFDRELGGIFEVQDTITAMIAASIEPQIGAAERHRVERGGSGSFRTWDLFHLGAQFLYKATPGDNQEAQKLLRRAVETDSRFAQGYAFLSYAIILSMLYFDAEPTQERLKEAHELARRGIELDQQDAMIRFVYGRVLLARRHYMSALDELKLAVEMNPTLAVGHCGVGDSLAYNGRFEEAFPHFQRALDLSPHDPQRWAFYAYRALAHLFAQQFEHAAEWALKATQVPNCIDWPFSHRVSALGHLGKQAELKVAVEELLEHRPDFSCSLACRRLFYVKDNAHLEVYLQGLRKAGIP